MDSGSGGNPHEEIQVCKNDNVENANETVEENVPKILSPELSDVFIIFVNMLDVKSFMKLAMASKKMYKRCMKDKAIKINVDVDKLEARKSEVSGDFRFSFPSDSSSTVPFQRLPCKATVRSLAIHGDIETSKMTAFNSYMKENGVYRIYNLTIRDNFEDLGAITEIIQEFNVKSLSIWNSVNDDILRSILQLNLDFLHYSGPLSSDFILEVDTSIREISFPGITDEITEEQLMLIMSRIQSGALPKLILDEEAIDWYSIGPFSIQHFNEHTPLPERRPLVLARVPSSGDISEYWFLHSNGGITKCVTDDLFACHRLYKCEEWEYPWVIRKEKDILKDLEKRRDVSCNANQFRTFSSSFTMLARFHRGPLPEIRPLCYKNSISFGCEFWLLDEEDNLMDCVWEEGKAMWNSDHLSGRCKEIESPALGKYVFWKVLKKMKRYGVLKFPCEDVEEFGSWFVKFVKLDSEYSGSLPTTRPLIFKYERSRNEDDELPWTDLRIVLIDDHLVECRFTNNTVHIRHISYLDNLDVLFVAKSAVDAPKDRCHGEVHLNIRFGKLRAFISKKTDQEFWLMVDKVYKVALENGCLTISQATLCESPPIFMKEVFKCCAEKKQRLKASEYFALELGQFHSCLEQFTVVPFDYSGPLKPDSPLVFVKGETHYSYHKEAIRSAPRDCSNFSVLVWFLWNGIEMTNCSWGKGGPKKVFFGRSPYFNNVPLALRSKEYLKNLLLAKYDESTYFDWFGRFDDFLSYLNGYIKLPFDYNARLPNERPLVFDCRSDEKYPIYFILREDGTVIQCWKRTPHISMALYSPFSLLNEERVPPAVKDLF